MTSPLAPRQRALSFAAVLSCVFATTVALGLTLPLLSLLMERMGVPSTVIGANTATGAVALILFTPLLPWLTRKLGIFRYLALCIAVTPLLLLAFPLTGNVWAWFPIRFVMNAALLGLFVVSEVWINKLADERIRGRMTAAYAAIATLGFAFGPVILASVGTQGFTPFVIAAAVIAAAIVPLVLARKLVPRADETGGAHIFAYILLAPLAMFAAFYHGAAEQALTAFLPVYSVREGWTETNAALQLTAFCLGNVLFQLVIGWLSDVFDRRVVMIGCTAAALACAALLPLLIGDAMPLYAMMFVWGGAISAIYSVGLALLGQRFKGGDLPPANAAFALLYSIGSLAGPLLSGAAMEPGALGNAGLAWVVGGFAVPYLILGVSTLPRKSS